MLVVESPRNLSPAQEHSVVDDGDRLKSLRALDVVVCCINFIYRSREEELIAVDVASRQTRHAWMRTVVVRQPSYGASCSPIQTLKHRLEVSKHPDREPELAIIIEKPHRLVVADTNGL